MQGVVGRRREPFDEDDIQQLDDILYQAETVPTVPAGDHELDGSRGYSTAAVLPKSFYRIHTGGTASKAHVLCIQNHQNVIKPA
jgi:hypothetical protein